MEDDFKGLIERIRAEGLLTRNSGTNSLRAIKSVSSSIERVVMSQTSILEDIAKSVLSIDTSQTELVKDNKRKDRLGDAPDTDDRPEKVSDKTDKVVIPSIDGDTDKISMFASIFGSIGTASGSLIAPLKSVLRIVGKGGGLLTVAYLLYSTFHDIGENPEFTKAIENIRSTWNNKVMPTLRRLGDFFANLFGADSDSTMAYLLKIPGNFKDSMQKFVSDTINNISATFGEVSDGVNLLLDGEIGAGLATIVKGLFTGIVALADDSLTAVLTTFGVDFGPDGSLFKTLGQEVTDLLTSISDIWKGVTLYVAQKWTNITAKIKSLFGTISDPIIKGAKDAWKVITDLFTFGEEDKSAIGVLGKFQDIVFAPVNTAIGFVRGLFGFSEPTDEPFKLQDIVSDAMGSAISWVKKAFAGVSSIIQTKFAEFGAFLAGIPAKVWIEAERMFIDLSAKLRSGFIMLGDWLGSIPAQIKLLALETIRGVRGGGLLVGEDDVAEAREAVQARGANLSGRLAEIESDRLKKISKLEERAAETTVSAQSIANAINNSTDSRSYSTTTNNFMQTISPDRSIDPAKPF